MACLSYGRCVFLTSLCPQVPGRRRASLQMRSDWIARQRPFPTCQFFAGRFRTDIPEARPRRSVPSMSCRSGRQGNRGRCRLREELCHDPVDFTLEGRPRYLAVASLAEQRCRDLLLKRPRAGRTSKLRTRFSQRRRRLWIRISHGWRRARLYRRGNSRRTADPNLSASLLDLATGARLRRSGFLMSRCANLAAARLLLTRCSSTTCSCILSL